MHILPTRAQIAASPDLANALLEKSIARTTFDRDDLTHAEIQYCFTNNIPIERAVLYSPVKTQAQIDVLVPLAWPGSTKTVDEVEVRLSWAEYTRVTKVTGGFVLFYRGSDWRPGTNTCNRPTNGQLRAWEGMHNGFLTDTEVKAIQIVEPE